MADWRWECVTDDLLDGLPPDVLRAIQQSTGNVLTDPESSAVNGTRLVMEHGHGDLSGPWRVSYHHYVAG